MKPLTEAVPTVTKKAKSDDSKSAHSKKGAVTKRQFGADSPFKTHTSRGFRKVMFSLMARGPSPEAQLEWNRIEREHEQARKNAAAAGSAAA